MTTVVLGAGGMLGRDLVTLAPAANNVIGFTHADLDVRDGAAVDHALRDLRARCVVNATGFTNVDAAERDRETALAVNATAVGELGRICRAIGARLVHFSTDYVFDGTKDGFYSEADATNPLSYYAETKLAGEHRLRDSGADHAIIRTQWLFGHEGKSFVSLIRDRAERGLSTRAADDQFGCCTYSVDLARVSWALVEAGARGTYHVANRGVVSRYALAKAVFDALGSSRHLTACSKTEFETAARRPDRSPLNVAKVERLLGKSMPTWEDALGRYLGAAREVRNRALVPRA